VDLIFTQKRGALRRGMERVAKRAVGAVVGVTVVCGLLVAVVGGGPGEGASGGRLVIPSHRSSIGRVPLSEREEPKPPPVGAAPPPSLPASTPPTASTKFRAPNPQSYNRPVSAEATIVFPDDDETAVVAVVRGVDEALGRPSDMHAIILESGEDSDAFSRALHEFQERTYSNPQMDPSPPAPHTRGWPEGDAQLQGRHHKRHHYRGPAGNHLRR